MNGFRVLYVGVISAIVIILTNYASATVIEFSPYEFQQISDSVEEDCKSSTFLYICSNDWYGLYNLVPKECTELVLDKTALNEIIDHGELQKYYKGEQVNLDFYEGELGGARYFVRIEDIKKAQIENYLSFLNHELLVGYADFPLIICYTDKSTDDTRALSIDEHGNKKWGDKVIEEPRTFLSIGEVSFGLIGGVSIISLFSIAIFSIPILIILKKKTITILGFKIAVKKVRKKK